MVLLKGWRYAAFVGLITGTIGLAIYPIIISPMIDPEPYSKQLLFTGIDLFLNCIYYYRTKASTK